MTLGREAGGRLPTDKPREFRCSECRARCTESRDGEVEYGHLVGCSHRPEEWPRGGKHTKHADYADGKVVTDGGTFDCDGCGDETAVSKRCRYMPPGQSDVGSVQYDDLCPTCSTRKPSERLFRAAEDQRGER